jgi:hypothetical protein
MIMLNFAIACTLGAALSFLGTLGFAQDVPPPHQSIGPIHHGHNYQPTQDELNELDQQDVTRKEAHEIDRLYNQLESTGGQPQVMDNESQGDDESDETGLAKEIGKENRLLDRTLNICRGC